MTDPNSAPKSASKSAAVKRAKLSVEDYVQGVLSGGRASLARAITLIESTHPLHQQDARETIDRLLPDTGRSIRLGISGVPGVGKSTFIEALGSMLTSSGHRVAVLAVDPSSTRTGGSILGDKTRMQKLSVDPKAFIRPSPTSGVLGGVTRVTRETILLCEAAGFDVIIVETVGVGQSEIAIAEMVDFFLLLMLPGAGDELQGIKKGVLESADMIAVNKADRDDGLAADQAAVAYQRALHVMEPLNPDWAVPVKTCSGLTGNGMETIWECVMEYQKTMQTNNHWTNKREQQQVRWMHELIERMLLAQLIADSDRADKVAKLETDVRLGKLSPVTAASKIAAYDR